MIICFKNNFKQFQRILSDPPGPDLKLRMSRAYSVGTLGVRQKMFNAMKKLSSAGNNNNYKKTGVINDPLDQTHSHASNDHRFLLFCFSRLKSGDGRTDNITCAKTMIPTDRDFGLAEWIKNNHLVTAVIYKELFNLVGWKLWANICIRIQKSAAITISEQFTRTTPKDCRRRLKNWEGPDTLMIFNLKSMAWWKLRPSYHSLDRTNPMQKDAFVLFLA